MSVITGRPARIFIYIHCSHGRRSVATHRRGPRLLANRRLRRFRSGAVEKMTGDHPRIPARCCRACGSGTGRPLSHRDDRAVSKRAVPGYRRVRPKTLFSPRRFRFINRTADAARISSSVGELNSGFVKGRLDSEHGGDVAHNCDRAELQSAEWWLCRHQRPERDHLGASLASPELPVFVRRKALNRECSRFEPY